MSKHANSATFEKPTSNNSKPVKKPAVKPAQKKVTIPKAPVVKKEESKKEAQATDSKPKDEQKEIVAELIEPASYAKIKDEDGAMEVANRMVELAKASSSIVVKAYEVKWDELANEEKEKTNG